MPWFPQPRFADEKERQVARLLNRLTIATLAAYGIVFLIGMSFSDRRTMAVTAASSLLLPVILWLIQHRRLFVASLVLSTSVLVTVTLLATFGQGYRDLAMLAFPIILVFTSLTLRRAVLLVNAGLTLLAFGWLVFGEMLGWYVPLPIETYYWVDFLILVVILAVTVVAVALLSANIRKNMALAQDELDRRALVEAALLDSESRFRAIAEQALDGISLADTNGKFLFVNQAFCTMTGYAEGELLEMGVYDLKVPDDEEQTFNRVIGQKQANVRKKVLRRKDGTILYADINGKIITVNGTDVAVGIVRDVSAEVANEAELIAARDRAEASEARLQGMLDTMLDAFFQADLNGNFTFANAAALRMYGYGSIDEIIGMPAAALYAEKEARDALIETLRRTGELSDWIGRGLRKDGTSFWVSMNVQILRDKNGNPIGTQGVARDITERKEVEETLVASEEKYRRIVECSPFAKYFYRLENNGRLILAGANPSADRIIGIRHQELVGKTLEEAFPGLASTAIPAMYRKIAGGELGVQSFEIPYDDARFSGIYDVTVFQALPNYIVVDFVDVSERKRVEAVLKESEARYKQLFDAIPESVLLIGTDRRVIAANQASALLYSYESPEQLEGFDTRLLIAERDRERAARTQTDILHGAERPAREYIEVRRDGSEFIAEVVSTTLRGPQGEVTGYIGITRDITEYRRAEEAVRTSEERLQLAVIAGTIGIWDWDIINDSLVWDASMYSLYGLRAGDFAGAYEAWISALHPDDRQAIDDAIQAALRGEQEYAPEFRIIRPDGEVRVIQASSRTFHGPDGKPLRMIGTNIDITGSKRAEAALAQSKEKFSKAFNLNPSSILLTRVAGSTVIEVNDTFCRVFGYDRTEIIGSTTIDKGLWVDLRDRERLLEMMLSGKKLHRIELSFRAKDGRVLACMASFELMEMDGELYSLAIVEDISGLKKAEEARRRLEDQLRQEQKLSALGTLASGVAHEINNPLNGVINYAQLCIDRLPPGTDNIKEYCGEIIAEGERITTIVRNLLAFSRQEKGVYTSADPGEVTRSILALAGKLLSRDSIEIVTEITPDLPAIHCQSSQIQQVLLNLLTNARDALNERWPGYHEDKQVRIMVGSLVEGTAGFIRITVRDNGNGVPVEVQDRIFDPFFTTKGQHQGTGLGLAISHGIVQEHGGKLSFETAPGAGTAFHLDLPVDAGVDRAE